MVMSRRQLLGAAGASVLVLGAGGTSFSLTRRPSAALRPWEDAGEGLDDPRLDALSFAILAPNPHNRQPWLVRLVKDNAIDLHCQLDRRLPQTDPYDRQITIGLGCFLALYQLAAARRGFLATVEPFPQGEPQPRLDGRPVARVTLAKAKASLDPLFDQVSQRRSTKEPFDTTRAVDKALLQSVLRAGRQGKQTEFTVDAARVQGMRQLSFAAFLIETRTRRTYLESVSLMRIGKSEINARPDGIDIGGTMPELLNTVGVLTRETLADANSSAYAQGIEMYRAMMFSAMGYVWIRSSGNSRTDQLQAGADWLRLHLAASQAGLAVHPISQALQEFPEMRALNTQVHRDLGVRAPDRLQMLGRVGYGPEVAPSPRWPLQTRILSS